MPTVYVFVISSASNVNKTVIIRKVCYPIINFSIILVPQETGVGSGCH